MNKMTYERMVKATFSDWFKDRYNFRPRSDYSIKRMIDAMDAWERGYDSEFDMVGKD
jgi:hypothetical protein